MIHITEDGQFDIIISNGQIKPSDIISDILAIIGSTVANPVWADDTQIDTQDWYGNVYMDIPLGYQLTNYASSGIRNLGRENILISTLKDACQPLINIGRIKDVEAKISTDPNKLGGIIFDMIFTLPNNEKLPLQLPLG